MAYGDGVLLIRLLGKVGDRDEALVGGIVARVRRVLHWLLEEEPPLNFELHQGIECHRPLNETNY